jgi:D-alanyl-D-alanine carboxypeptidase
MSLSKSLLLSALLGFSFPLATISIAQTVLPQHLDAESRPALESQVRGLMERQQIPGMAVVVIKDGLILEMRGYGVSDKRTQQAVTPDTRFCIGSNTKPFTAMAIMLLVEEGKVNLDQPIRQYLDNLPTQWQPLTVRQLLSHTSGISEDGYWRKRQRPEDLLRLINSRLDFTPGETWMYSNSGFALAGLIIEKASGQSYQDFLRERIFQPLGMDQTQAQLEPLPNLATGYSENRSRDPITLQNDPNSFASGNIISTARDMAKWAQALDQGRLISPSSYQQLWTAMRLNNGRSVQYGLGWNISSLNGHARIAHSGNGYGFASGLVRYPNDRLDVIILSNNMDVDGSKIAAAIAQVYDPGINLESFSPQPDPNPEFTREFLALLQSKDTTLSLAPELQIQLETERGKESLRQQTRLSRRLQQLEFLHQETNDGDQSYYYRSSLNGTTVYIGIRMTAQQQIAGYGISTPP